MKKVVFIDRDGTIVKEPRDEQIDSLEKLEFVPGIILGLKLLVDSGYSLVMVSNQDGLGTARYPKKAFTEVQQKILDTLRGEGIVFDEVFICPHLENDECACRKPKIGLVQKYLKTHRIDPMRSFVVGDRETDVKFAENLGLKSVRLSSRKSTKATYQTPDASDACNFVLRWNRIGIVHRATHETNVDVEVIIDGSGSYSISTGIGFFDHMLEQIARHSGFDMNLRAKGDLHIDEHHTVEDVGIALGHAISNALGEKRGIERFAAPLDEALASVVLDLSGRSHLTFQCTFQRERVGNLPTELVEDFFGGLVQGLEATVHIKSEGRNDHHKIEAIFKSFGRALKSAASIDRRRIGSIPSTKGTL